ncbi:MAG: type II toxin-antitoxin system death-on-curing family toxin [bacterium]|nr:type II toxin-antitoxin system death-on-curing family toxin [bacterium]
MKVLSQKQVLQLHAGVIQRTGGTEGVRDHGLLDSALNAPFQTFDSEELYPSLIEKAVRLGYGIIKNHPFLDGNKRIGTHAMLVLLDINGITLEYEDQDLIDTILNVASGSMDYQELLNWVSLHVV